MKPPGGRRRVLEVGLVLFLLALSFALYLTLARKGGRGKAGTAHVPEGELEDGLNLYRLESFEKAGFVLRGVLENRPSRGEGFLASLYLGNIAYIDGDYGSALALYEKAAGYDPKSAFALYNSACACLAIGEPERALRYALRSLGSEENLAAGAVLAGNLYRARGEYGKAYDAYEKAGTEAGIVGFNKAAVSLLMGDRERACSLLGALIGRGTDERSSTDDRRSGDRRSSALAGLSRAFLGCWLRDGNRAKAVEHLLEALRVFPGSVPLKYDAALLLMKEGRFEEALPLLRVVDAGGFAGTPAGADFDALLGIALFKNAKYPEALAHYLSLAEGGASGDALAIVGDVYLKLGDVEEAKRYYRKAVPSSGGSGRELANAARAGTLLNLVRIMIGEKRLEEGFRVCADAREAVPGDPLPALCEARLHFAAGGKNEGIGALREATALAKDDPAALRGIAALYAENGLAGNALQVYHRVLARDEHDATALAGIARVYAASGHSERADKFFARALRATADIDVYYELSVERAGTLNSRDAASVYRELVRQYPYRFEAYHNLALLLLASREYEAAERLVERCLASNRAHPDRARSNLLVLMGAAQRALGRHEDARKSFVAALQLDRRNPYPARNLREMESAAAAP